MKKILGKTADGAVVIDRFNSHLHGEVTKHLHQALSTIKTNNKQFIEAEVDFHRNIGFSACVSTSSNDCIVFATRQNRNGFSRFVLNKEKMPTSFLTVVLKKTNDKPSEYVLITAYIGEKSEVEPWDKHATEKSVDFWKSHALVWGEPVLLESVTADVKW